MLTKDVLCYISLKLDLLSFVNFCKSSKAIYDKIYNHQSIWFRLLIERFPDHKRLGLENSSYKETYVLLSNLTLFKTKMNWALNIYQIYNAETFIYCDCRLKQIPKEIVSLHNLKYLYFDHNQLTQFDILCKLKNLKRLSLENNLITKIPKEINNLSNLESLDLGDNKIKKVPDSIIELKQLRRLDLGDNRLERIPLLKEYLPMLNFIY